MKLYQTPNGTWCGTEKDWKAAMKTEGASTKDARKIIEVPTAKPALLEFLTFHNVNVISPQPPAGTEVPVGGGAIPPAPMSAGTPTTALYDSPLNARTVIASIDAGMCAAAVLQMEGRPLAQVVGAAIERMAQLKTEYDPA